LFVLGVLGLSLSTATQVLPLYYLSCAIMGTGTGIGYVSPIKQLMSAYEDHKGMASGLAISGFGLGKFVAAPIYEYLLANCSLPVTFLLIGCLFAVILVLSNCLFKPDPRYVSTIYTAIPIKNLLKNKLLTMSYISVWLMFCINISCGLAIISQEKGLLLGLGFTDIALILSITAIMNILGRFGFSTLSDYKGRKAVYHFICSFGILAALFCFTGNPVLSLIGIFLCELAYGGNFSTLPSLLSKYFGDSSVSTVHAITLTGWGCAGIFSILLANFFTTSTLFIILGILYLIGFVMMEVFLKQR
jgi:OFA family oxalate/formate antiporter-like MFS transporter